MLGGPGPSSDGASAKEAPCKKKLGTQDGTSVEHSRRYSRQIIQYAIQYSRRHSITVVLYCYFFMSDTAKAHYRIT